MALGENLVAEGLVSPEQVAQALELQKTGGGTLGGCLIELGAITEEQLEAFFDLTPPPLRNLEGTGLSTNLLMQLTLKLMDAHNLQTAQAISADLKLPAIVVRPLLEQMRERQLIESLGADKAGLRAELRFAVAPRGREWLGEARAETEYLGPAPVPLAAYTRQMERQRITNDRVNREAIDDALTHLVIDEDIISRLGPAMNSGRALLLYGPPGNGKTSIALAIAQSFEQSVYVPYAVEADGQIIKVFDPEIHQIAPAPADVLMEEEGDDDPRARIRAHDVDGRWVRCYRPVSVTGGELAMDMLELSYNPYSRFYEAPLQMKATGGVFVIDDFGRQVATPAEVLNRWILPLERKIDYLTLHTGRKFAVPFDGLVIFSTNLRPQDIMDGAMLRRIPYNFFVGDPSEEEMKQIFERVCGDFGLTPDETIFTMVTELLYRQQGLEMARYHPRFIVDHVVARCRYEGRPPSLEPALIHEAAENLFIKG
ncbi:MAG: AAA family ATPase [Alphaproteobacteria bacterium]